MATLSELRAEVRELIGAGIFDRCFEDGWANEGIAFAVNQAASLLGLTFVVSSSIQVQGCYAQAPLDALVLQNVRVAPASEVLVGRMLMQSTRLAEDMKNPDWRDRTAEPTVWIKETGSVIRLNGQPASGSVLIGYIQIPTPMAADDDEPDDRIPPVLHPHLKYAAAAYLCKLSGEGQDLAKAQDYFQTFGSLIGVGPLKLSEAEVDL